MTKIYQLAKLVNRNEFKALKTLLAFSGKTTAQIISAVTNIFALMVTSLLDPEKNPVSDVSIGSFINAGFGAILLSFYW